MKRALAFVLCALFVSSAASADIGRAMTKRERQRAEKASGRAPDTTDLYDRIHERFLSDDHPAVLRLAAEYPEKGKNREDVLALKRLSEAKLRRDAEILRPSAVRPLLQSALEESALFSVQVGSFAKEENARSLVRELAHQKWDARVEPADGRWRVRVGRYENRSEAEAAEERLKKAGYPAQTRP